MVEGWRRDALRHADGRIACDPTTTAHTPRLQRPRGPARVQHCEAAEPLPGEFQVCAPRKPAVLSLMPGASRRKADSRHVRSGW